MIERRSHLPFLWVLRKPCIVTYLFVVSSSLSRFFLKSISGKYIFCVTISVFRGVHRRGAKGAMAPPELILGGQCPPKNVQKFDFRGAKVSFLGGKINFEGCNSRKFFRASRESFFCASRKRFGPPQAKILWTPLNWMYECNYLTKITSCSESWIGQ